MGVTSEEAADAVAAATEVLPTPPLPVMRITRMGADLRKFTLLILIMTGKLTN